MFIKKTLEYIEKRMKPERYAKKIGVQIGDNCRIGPVVWGSEPYLITIGNHVTISCDVIFLTHDGGTWVIREQEKYKNITKFGEIKIGNNCFIGCRSTIMPGISMGDNSILGAHSLLTKSIPSGEVWAGCPAKFLMTIEEYANKCQCGPGNIALDINNKKRDLLDYFNKNNKGRG